MDNIENKIKKVRKRSDNLYWRAASPPLFGIGITTVIRGEDVTEKILGAIIILYGLWFLFYLGLFLGDIFDFWVVNASLKLRSNLLKLKRRYLGLITKLQPLKTYKKEKPLRLFKFSEANNFPSLVYYVNLLIYELFWGAQYMLCKIYTRLNLHNGIGTGSLPC